MTSVRIDVDGVNSPAVAVIPSRCFFSRTTNLVFSKLFLARKMQDSRDEHLLAANFHYEHTRTYLRMRLELSQ